MDDIISMIVADGLWAALFCALFVYNLRDSRSRETRYAETIHDLSEKLGVVINDVKSGVETVISVTSEIRSEAESIIGDVKKLCAASGIEVKRKKKAAAKAASELVAAEAAHA